jgi:transcription initiation factor TFIIIB Brf1 subunit/transcription initiation factor TFIIB
MMAEQEDVKLPSDALEEMWTEELALSDEVWRLAKDMAEVVDFHPDLPAARPKSIAASCLWIATIIENEKRSQQVIVETVGGPRWGIRNNKAQVAEIVDQSDLDVPPLGQLYETKEPASSASRGNWLWRLLR